jgi:spore germination cell wall hydrolase CwlJ-like protein
MEQALTRQRLTAFLPLNIGLGPLRKRPQAPGSSRPVPRQKIHYRARRGVLREYGPVVFAGAMLVAAFGFAGHIVGKNAVAHTSGPSEITLVPSAEPLTLAKGSLMPEGLPLRAFDDVNLELRKADLEQTVVQEGKGDGEFRVFLDDVPPPIEAPVQPALMIRPQTHLALATPTALAIGKSSIRIEPAALKIEEEPTNSAVKRLSLQPKPAKIEKEFSLDKQKKQKVVAQRRVRLAEENCLARAVYFEARSESELGQMAVAKVILNRTRSEGFPKTICGVVYQGSNRRNSCQFSFACDGLPDDVRDPAAWERSKSVAKRAIAGDASVASKMKGAINYHADYVKPKWSKTMKRLVKIGRHIFYADG